MSKSRKYLFCGLGAVLFIFVVYGRRVEGSKRRYDCLFFLRRIFWVWDVILFVVLEGGINLVFREYKYSVRV